LNYEPKTAINKEIKIVYRKLPSCKEAEPIEWYNPFDLEPSDRQKYQNVVPCTLSFSPITNSLLRTLSYFSKTFTTAIRVMWQQIN